MSTTVVTTSSMADVTNPQNMTPPYSASDYATSSPTSPQKNVFLGLDPHPATRQIRPPKSPLYVPAVLRPTEKPSKGRPLTPPRSLHSSTDSLSAIRPASHGSGSASAGAGAGAGAAANRPHTPSQPITIITALTRSSTASSGPSTPNSVQPTRAHWKADADATHCDAPGCSLAFSFLTRRHHCRRCGGIFCAGHAGVQVPLDENAELSEEGTLQRACESCFGDWVGYNQGLVSRRMRGDAMAAQGHGHGHGHGALPVGAKGPKKTGKDVAGSVPKDWSWSTF